MRFCNYYGKRFVPKRKGQLFCCEKCASCANNIKKNEIMKESTRKQKFEPQLCAEINERAFDVKYKNDSYVHRADFYLGF